MIRLYHGKYRGVFCFKGKSHISDKIFTILSISTPISLICFIAKLKYNDDSKGLSRQKYGGG